MNHFRITRFKKFISIVLVVLLLASNVTVLPIFAANRAGLSGKTILGDSVLNYEHELVDNGDGTFSYKITLDSAYAVVDKNIDSAKSQDGYFTAAKSGQYLIELWGGDGGSGAKTTYNEGGKGGKGGHIYGTVHLDVGETLYWQLGGHGSQTSVSGTGGGANGTGGGHGDWGSYTIGGGGGFSAVYKFDPYTFESVYTDDSGELIGEIKENDRNSKYIMIAGGGGGGGAGNGYALGATITGTPDGGAGGSIGSTAGELNGAGYDVEGTFFKGSDGRSSGTSTGYVGKGATNLPGKVSNTILEWAEGTQPNDWKGTYNTSTAGGSGGTGELRGGGGGAGFCGGSGGCMTSIILPSNVGGGGGGSSFISDEVTYTDLDAEATSYLKNTNPAETGGAVCVTYLGEVDKTDFQNIEISAAASDYFQVKVAYATINGVRKSIAEIEGQEHQHDGKHVHIEGINLVNAADGTASMTSSKVVLEIVLEVKRGFAGGNNVPLLSDPTDSTKLPIIKVTNGSGDEQIISVSEDCGYANVPYNITINPRSHITNIVGNVFQHTELYWDPLADARLYLNGNNPTYADAWMYDFIQSISPYYITDHNKIKLDGTSVAPIVTTNYFVATDVVPKNTGIAKVGEPVTATTLYKTATITVISHDETILNNNVIKYGKNLEYNASEGRYELSLNIEADINKATVITPEAITAVSDANSTHVRLTEEIEESGWYRIDMWGGNGGSGGGSLWGGTGGSGGTGGFIYGYIHLDKGDILTGGIGRNGYNSSESYLGADSGKITSIVLQKKGQAIGDAQPLLVAGSGGGGGGAQWLVGTAGNGGSVDNSSYSTEFDADYSDYMGANGTNSGWTSSGQGGAAGKNYFNTTLMSTTSPAIDTAPQRSDHNVKTLGGAIRVTCVKLDPPEDAAGDAILSNYTFETQLSRYFTVSQEAISVLNTNSSGEVISVITPSSIRVTGKNIKIEGIDPEIHTSDVLSTINHVHFKVLIPFNPETGFMGGNDVPVITATSELVTGMEFGQEEIDGVCSAAAFNVPAKLTTDYANVTIDAGSCIGTLGVEDKYRTQGSPGVHRHDMYEWTHAALPTGEESWKADYVKEIETISLKEGGALVESDPIVPNPDVTTTYVVQVGIVPLGPADYATVISSVDGVTHTKDVTIQVTTYLTYKLTNLSTSAITGPYGNVNVVPGFPHEATLTPADKYMLPDSISVTYDVGGEAVPHIYNKTNGYIHIAAEYLNEPITITASGKQETHKLYYAWQEYNGEGNEPIEHIDLSKQYYDVTCGTPIAPYASSIYAISVPDYPGHEFVWGWGTVDGAEPELMPHGDVLVRGTYQPIECTLTINYLKESVLDSTTTVALKYNDNYSIVSPIIPGYVTDWPVVSGTITTDTALDVNYIKANGRLTINYIYGDTNELITVHETTMNEGNMFSVPSPDVPGYELADPAQAVISGQMDADGETFRVYYNPAHYVVTFDTNDGTPLGTPTREAIYNSIYMLEGSSGEYIPLPTPINVGHEFRNWYYLDGTTKVAVYDDTLVTLTSDHTLYADWGARSYTITVEYVNEHGVEIASSASITLPLGQYYSFNSPVIDGYTLADPENQTAITGEVQAQNTLITVHYVKNTHTLKIYYKYSDTIKNTELHGKTPDGISSPAIYVIPNGEAYHITSPAISGYHPSVEAVTGTMGTKDIETTVVYLDDVAEISVTITWSDMTFSYSYGAWQPDIHKYADDTIAPSSVNSNKITVSNNSDIGVTAQFSYTPAVSYESVDAYFTSGDRANSAQITGYNLEKVDSQSAWLWLTGTFPEGTEGTITSGTCTVTIRGGWLL